ncbi:hypothetical protein GGI11_000628 [Coemansia sp. RSA 2049]|nr:hypothetical protein GGI11_000628 [Coemansia sp. RSA 2049]
MFTELYTLLTVLVVRRSYFTSLWNVPGPLLNTFTNVPLNYHTLRGDYHSYTEKLHSAYGPVVRVGHNIVSISDPAELRQILATHEFPKGRMYDLMRSFCPSIFSTRDPELNKLRRRQLGNSYSLPSVRLYEDKVLKHGVLSLISQWDAQIASSPTAGSALVNFYYGFHSMAFDIIGVLGFGKSFEILSSGDKKIIDCVSKSNMLSVVRSRLPFGMQLQRLFRDLYNSRQYLIATVRDTIRRRKQENAEAMSLSDSKHGNANHDILQKFLDARDPLTGESLDTDSLESEAFVLLAGGTDTVSNTLSWAITCLLGRPETYERLKRDIRTAFPDKSIVIRFDEAKAKLPYLTAVIHETMRLHPAVAGYIPRCVPEQGADILDERYYLPKGTEVGISLFACNRNKAVWEDPTDFDPNRFMGLDTVNRFKDVLTFSSGVRICAGRFLATAEMYTTLANLILRYDFKYPADRETRLYDSVGKIPGKSFFNYRLENPKKDCQMIVSRAT